MKWYYRNPWPKCIEKTWSRNPRKGQRVEVQYSASTNCHVWWDGEKFVNKYGFEVYNIVAWRNYNPTSKKSNFRK